MRRKLIMFLGVIILVFLCIYLWMETGKSIVNQAPETITTASTTNILEIPTAGSDLQTKGDLVASMIGTLDSQLYLNWFYIDQSRMYLEISLCNMPIPDGFEPLYLIDPANIRIKTSEGTPIEIHQYSGGGGSGGGDGEEQPVKQETSCFDQVFEYYILNSPLEISNKDTFSVEIPVGGSIPGENGQTKTFPLVNINLKIEPTYLGNLTFTVQKTENIGNKTITFKGVDLNPKSVAVKICVFDPDGEQWLPEVRLIYQGNVISPSSNSLADGSDIDSTQEMCYRHVYNYPINLEKPINLDPNLSVLVTSLSTVQPERLPDELIMRAQNELANEGIEFNYVVISHGANFVITKKPAALTDQEVYDKVYNAINEDTLLSDVIVFDFK